MRKPTFTLPVDDYIDVRSVPTLLAVAKYPDLGQPQQVTGLGKREGRATLELTDGDRQTLCNAWAPLPWPIFPIDMAAWQRYADALAASSSPPPWALVTLIHNPGLNDRMLRTIASHEYRAAVEMAMKDGTLEWRRALTLLPVRPRTFDPADAFRDGAFVVSRAALKTFAETAGFKVQRGREEPPNTIRAQGRKAQMGAAKDAAKELWIERELGRLPGFPRNVDFAAECVKRWPILSQTTITQKWIPLWRREHRPSRK